MGTQNPVTERDPNLGLRVGPYVITRRLGAGGMAAVYAAKHDILPRWVAIKLLDPALCADPGMVDRFKQEATAAAALNHQNIVQVETIGRTESDQYYIVMERLEGQSLRDAITPGGMPLPRALTILTQILRGLRRAHAEGIIHRDLKPDNIFLVNPRDEDEDERVKILDFGIAKLQREGTAGATQEGEVMGTPGLMAPEQIGKNAEVDGRADIYALGATLYWVLTGQIAFAGDSLGLIMRHQLQGDIRPFPTEANVPPALQTLILWMMAAEPSARPESVEAVEAELTRLGFLRRSTGRSVPEMPVAEAHPISAPRPVAAAPTPAALQLTVLPKRTEAERPARLIGRKYSLVKALRVAGWVLMLGGSLLFASNLATKYLLIEPIELLQAPWVKPVSYLAGGLGTLILVVLQARAIGQWLKKWLKRLAILLAVLVGVLVVAGVFWFGYQVYLLMTGQTTPAEIKTKVSGGRAKVSEVSSAAEKVTDATTQGLAEPAKVEPKKEKARSATPDVGPTPAKATQPRPRAHRPLPRLENRPAPAAEPDDPEPDTSAPPAEDDE